MKKLFIRKNTANCIISVTKQKAVSYTHLDVYKRQQVTVKGTVISSENNEPVIGASVLVKGTTNGTITDINGQFTLTNISPTNKTIIVSFIGMEMCIRDRPRSANAD